MWQLSCILLFIIFIAWFGLHIVIITCSAHRNVKINLVGNKIFNVIVFNVGLYYFKLVKRAMNAVLWFQDWQFMVVLILYYDSIRYRVDVYLFH